MSQQTVAYSFLTKTVTVDLWKSYIQKLIQSFQLTHPEPLLVPTNSGFLQDLYVPNDPKSVYFVLLAEKGDPTSKAYNLKSLISGNLTDITKKGQMLNFKILGH